MPILVLRMLDLFPMSRGSAASVQSCVMLLTGSTCIGLAVPALAGSLALLSAGSLACTAGGCVLWCATLRTQH